MATPKRVPKLPLECACAGILANMVIFSFFVVQFALKLRWRACGVQKNECAPECPNPTYPSYPCGSAHFVEYFKSVLKNIKFSIILHTSAGALSAPKCSKILLSALLPHTSAGRPSIFVALLIKLRSRCCAVSLLGIGSDEKRQKLCSCACVVQFLGFGSDEKSLKMRSRACAMPFLRLQCDAFIVMAPEGSKWRKNEPADSVGKTDSVVSLWATFGPLGRSGHFWASPGPGSGGLKMEKK